MCMDCLSWCSDSDLL